jgi:hypothetical protein
MLVVALICVFLSSLYVLKQQKEIMERIDNIEKFIDDSDYIKRK